MILENNGSNPILMAIFLGIAGICFIIFLIYMIFNSVMNNRVKQNSSYYKEAVKINDETIFKQIDNQYHKVHYTLNTKRQFDNFNYNKKSVEYILGNRYVYATIVDDVEYNKRVYQAYMKRIDSIEHTKDAELANSLKMSLASMVSRETILVKKILKKPEMDYEIDMTISYTSPKGRNSYRGSCTIDYGFIKTTIYSTRSRNQEIKSPSRNTNISPIYNQPQPTESDNTSHSSYRPTNSPKPQKQINSIDDLEEID